MIAPQSVLKPLAARKPNSQPKKIQQKNKSDQHDTIRRPRDVSNSAQSSIWHGRSFGRKLAATVDAQTPCVGSAMAV